MSWDVMLNCWVSVFQDSKVSCYLIVRVCSPFSLLFGHLEVKATLFFETSGATRITTQLHIPDDLNSQ
jgi:hypothetical protein